MILGKLYRNEFFCLCVKLSIVSVDVFFGVCKKKTAEMFLTSLFKMPDKSLSKEKLNLLSSGSVSSLHLNSKLLAYVYTQEAIASDQVVYHMAVQNNVET